MEIPGHVVWHLDVQHVGARFEALVAAFPVDRDTSHTRLFHLVSDDGSTFERPRLIIEPSRAGWDSRFIYRSTFVAEPGDHYRIWYSAASWNRRAGIGLVSGPLNRLRPEVPADVGTAERMAWLADNAIGYAKYRLKPYVPEAVRARLRR